MLKSYRKNKNITQQEIANILGIGVSTYNQYENGMRNIPIDIVEKLIEILDLDKDIFLPIRFTVSKDIL